MIFLLVLLAADPITITGSIDHPNIKLGEVATVTFDASYPEGAVFDISKIGGALSDFNIQDTGTSDENFKRSIWFKVKPELSGSYIIPKIDIEFSYQEESGMVSTTPLFLEVAKDEEALKGDIRDIKRVIELMAKWDIWDSLIVIVVIGAVITAIYFYRKKHLPKVVVKIISPRERGLAVCFKLNEKMLASDYVKFFDILSMEFRQYFESIYKLNVTDKTLEEIVASIHSVNIADNLKKDFTDVLTIADSVKFAKYKTSGGELDLVNKFKNFIEITSPEIEEDL